MEDFSLLTPRNPNSTERIQLRRRLGRLQTMDTSIAKATSNMARLAAEKPKLANVLIRRRFVRRTERAPGDHSDRSLPPRPLRPPSTRIMSPRGAALRFYLTALFEAQVSEARADTRPVNNRSLRGTHDDTGWADLLASPARNASGNVYMNVAAKKRRQIHEALGRLHREELVALPNINAGSNKYEGFRLMDEGGAREQGPNELYRLPKAKDKDAFELPITFFTQGWVHCFEDTELAFVLMMASLGATTKEVTIEGAIRLLCYGLGRDAYEAHVMLNRLGLLEVRPAPNRYADGKIQNYGGPSDAHLHSFKLLPEGFETPAYHAVLAAIDKALDQDGDN
ncbi:hypothetical protein [Saccharopolyspora mangrovi]|uniref:Uncharacterized protein n=1 Tax=Saccharopolyspora mangrovi TaxID=3082379 RepID=A0ABU6AIM8_9PSEU|nr:hypothetical protein [Saccharopolyspora sp. S2-29]MEB3371281.1 hypothetical protein [Saccharopolyspora sp. S2-29]